MPDTAVLQDAPGFLDAGVRLAADDFRGHDVEYRRHARVTPRHDNPVKNVALRDDTDELATAHDQQTADLVLVHEQSGIEYAGLGTNRQHMRTFDFEKISDSGHDVPLPRGRAPIACKAPCFRV